MSGQPARRDPAAWARKDLSGKSFSADTYDWVSQRLREMERVIRDRHQFVPDTDDAELYLVPVAQHLRQQSAQVHATLYAGEHKRLNGAGLIAPTLDRMRAWARRWAPEIAPERLLAIVSMACRSRGLPSAEALGKRLRLSYDERQRLKIRTIGSFDVDPEERARLAAERKRERDRLKKAAKRKRHGNLSREAYLAQCRSATRPWIALGISRATYYRRMKRAP